MAIQVSPGINISEYDATTIVPALSTTAGGIGGLFRWGPVKELVLIDSENNLVKRYGKPTTSFNAETWFTAKNFLAYGNQLYVSRAANTTDTSTSGAGTFSAIADTSGVVAANVAGNTYFGSNVNLNYTITNHVDYDTTLANGGFSTNPNFLFVAKYPGAIGSSLTVSTIDTAAKYSSNLVNIANTAFGPQGFTSGVLNANGSNFFNSNTAVFGFNDTTVTINAATVAANLASSVAWTNLTVGDFITVGNSTIGTQVLQLSNKGTAPTLVTNTGTLTTTTATITGLVGMSNALIGFSVGASIAGVANNTTIIAVPSATSVTLSSNFTGTTGSATVKFAQEFLNLSFYSPYTKSTQPTPVGGNVGRLWQFYGSVPSAPGVSYYGQNFGNTTAVDQIHAVVVDTQGKFTGVPGQVLEAFSGMSRATDAKTVDGSTNYYVNVINQQSQYVWWTNHPTQATTATGITANATISNSWLTTISSNTGIAVGQLITGSGANATFSAGIPFNTTVLSVNATVIVMSNNFTAATTGVAQGLTFTSATSYANTSANMTTLTGTAPTTLAFAGGTDGFTEAATGTNIGSITNAYDLFKSVESAPISLLLTGKSDDTNTTLLGNYLIQNIAQARQDCVAFISPNASSVVNNVGNELTALQTFRAGLTASSYGVLDSGYKYQYDKYNDVYRYVPLNGDIAGLCVYTDITKDPWWSPAGFNRGQIKNVVKLAYNPTKADRDTIYPLGINPVVTFPGQGTILDGDKTLANPSAFDRINVRRLFIVVEKAIGQAAQSSLFEFNDAFTQSQFVSLVTPFLKDVQGRRGITDFKVVCDATNNPPSVVDANQFVGDIYIKPARSINYIQLNFVAVRTGVSFSEIVGQF